MPAEPVRFSRQSYYEQCHMLGQDAANILVRDWVRKVFNAPDLEINLIFPQDVTKDGIIVVRDG